jgi:hypothetical protein
MSSQSGSSLVVTSPLTPMPATSTSPVRSNACAAPAAVSDAPAAITAPAAIRATRIRVFFVM